MKKMKKRILASALALALLSGPANAAFYTANEDMYYHAVVNCIAGSTYEISGEAARHFEKIACPSCVDRGIVRGEAVEIALPEGYVNLQDADFRDGRLLLCGFVNMQDSRPWLAVYDLQGNKLQELLGEATDDIVRDAKFLSDGKLALVRSIGGLVEGQWHVQLLEDGREVFRSKGAQYLSRIWPTDDGFLLYGGAKPYEYQLAKCDNNGNVLWTMDMDMFPLSDGQPGLTDILIGDGVHIAYGRRDPQGMNPSPVIVAFDDDGAILSVQEIGDANFGSFTDAAWAEDGAIFVGRRTNPGFAVKYGAEGQRWFRDLTHLNDANQELILEGKTARSGGISCMLALNGEYLLAIRAHIYTDRNPGDYRECLRMARMNGEGRITTDWFEDVGDIVEMEDLCLFSSGGAAYFLAYGGLINSMQAYDQGMTQPEIPRKLILKRIDV